MVLGPTSVYCVVCGSHACWSLCRVQSLEGPAKDEQGLEELQKTVSYHTSCDMHVTLM